MAATYGFEFRFRECGKPPTILDLLCKDTETLTCGDLANLETGELDLAGTSNSAILGQILETASGTDSTTLFRVIVDEDAIYGVTDANARLIGACLDISGSTGEMTVTSKTNDDLIVVRESSDAEETLVRIHPSQHALHAAS